MSNGSLILHRGAELVPYEALAAVQTPEATETWQPVEHKLVVDSVRTALVQGGAEIVKEEHSLTQGGLRYFGLMHLTHGNDGGNTVIGVRNSHDKTFPVGLSLGNRVFVCDNLSFCGDVKVVRKHTRYVARDLFRLIYSAIGRLAELHVKQQQRFEAYQAAELSDVQAHDLIIRALQAKVIGTDAVRPVVQQWHQPKHPEFEPRNALSLFNGFTEVLKSVRPTEVIRRTINLHGLLDQHCQLAV